MKKQLLVLSALLWVIASHAQPDCIRDSSLLTTGSLLSQAPYTPDSPFYNLKIACIGDPYEQSLSLSVPDSAAIAGTAIPLTSISIATSGAINGLPAGLTYSCNPPNCVFNANTLGCILVFGTLEVSNLPDTFEISINAIYSTPFGPVPRPLLDAGTHYYLILQSDIDCVGTHTNT